MRPVDALFFNDCARAGLWSPAMDMVFANARASGQHRHLESLDRSCLRPRFRQRWAKDNGASRVHLPLLVPDTRSTRAKGATSLRGFREEPSSLPPRSAAQPRRQFIN
jgi:hypothetical protein